MVVGRRFWREGVMEFQDRRRIVVTWLVVVAVIVITIVGVGLRMMGLLLVVGRNGQGRRGRVRSVAGRATTLRRGLRTRQHRHINRTGVVQIRSSGMFRSFRVCVVESQFEGGQLIEVFGGSK
jgi:hypothetical protein